MNQIVEDIRAFVQDNFLFGEALPSLTDDSSLIDEGIMDSAGVLELVAFLEETYDIEIADSELLASNLGSIGQISHYVARKQAGEESALKQAPARWGFGAKRAYAES